MVIKTLKGFGNDEAMNSFFLMLTFMARRNENLTILFLLQCALEACFNFFFDPKIDFELDHQKLTHFNRSVSLPFPMPHFSNYKKPMRLTGQVFPVSGTNEKKCIATNVMKKPGDKLHADTIFEHIFRELVLLSKSMETAQTMIAQLS
jgi:hypothetical protein